MPDSGAESRWFEMEVRGVILDPNSDSPIVVLRQLGESIYLPIWIGLFEANAIALALESIQPQRPMTHDLLRSVVESLGGRLERIEIHSLREGTFHARLIVRREAAGEPVEVDARPSDAIALALRVAAPVWASRQVLENAVTTSRAMENADEERLREWLANATAEDLGKYSM